MKSIRYIAEYIALLIALVFFKCLTPQKASDVGGKVASFIGPRLAVSRKALRNIELSFPEKSHNDHLNILRGMWDNLGRVLAEYPHIRTLISKYVSYNEDDLEQLKATDKQIMFISGHFANWELFIPAAYSHFNLIVAGVYRAPNNPHVARLLARMRDPHGTLTHFEKSKSGFMGLTKFVKSGGVAGFLTDQKLNQGPEVDFFGRPAKTGTAFIQLAKKYDCAVIPARIIRKDGCAFEISFAAALDLTQDDITILNTMHRHYEDWIRETPSQWLWLHRRWKDA